MRERFPARKLGDLLFRLADGSSTKELGNIFNKAVGEAGLKNSAHGVRTLYSLRHSCITWRLMSGDVNMEVLAKQCGTSVQMIEQHYSHVVPSMFAKELSGIDIGGGVKPKEIKISAAKQAKREARLTAQFKEWEVEVKRRGCV